MDTSAHIESNINWRLNFPIAEGHWPTSLPKPLNIRIMYKYLSDQTYRTGEGKDKVDFLPWITFIKNVSSVYQADNKKEMPSLDSVEAHGLFKAITKEMIYHKYPDLTESDIFKNFYSAFYKITRSDKLSIDTLNPQELDIALTVAEVLNSVAESGSSS